MNIYDSLIVITLHSEIRPHLNYNSISGGNWDIEPNNYIRAGTSVILNGISHTERKNDKEHCNQLPNSPFSISQKYVKHKMASCMAFLGCLWFTAKACFPLDSMYFDIIFKPVVLWHTLMHLNIPQIIRKV